MDLDLIAGVWSGCAIASLTGPALLPGRPPRRRSASSVEMAAPSKPACCDLILEVMRFLVSAMPFLVPALISALVTLIVLLLTLTSISGVAGGICACIESTSARGQVIQVEAAATWLRYPRNHCVTGGVTDRDRRRGACYRPPGY